MGSYDQHLDDYYKQREGDTERVSDLVTAMYLDADLVKVIAANFNRDSLDAKNAIGEAISEFITKGFADDAEDYARDQMFEKNIRTCI